MNRPNYQDAAKENAHAPIFAPVEWFEAAGVESNDGELNPFSSGRKFAAQRLGIATKSSLESAAILVFLCLLPRQRIDAARGTRWIDGELVDTESKFREDMEAWCDQIGVGFDSGTPAVAELRRIADEIWEAEDASRSQPKFPKGNGGTPNPN